MMTYGGSGAIGSPFSISALGVGEWSVSRLWHFTPTEISPGTHCILGRVSPRAGLEIMEGRALKTAQ
jgi:hypothetical protein